MFSKLKEEIENKFNDEISKIISTPTKRMYYYWTSDYFSRIDKINFTHYSIGSDLKKEINNLGKVFFNDSKIQLYINPNSHRNDITINNISLIFSSFIGKKQKHYEYLKEYCLWQIILKIPELRDIFDQQKNNFLNTYLKYITNENRNLSFNSYNTFNSTVQGKVLNEKLNQLEQKITSEKNLENLLKFRDKIDSLRVLNNKSPNLHFLFNIPGTENKEELRYALDKLSNNDGELLFRGQADSLWLLDSSVTRDSKLLRNERLLYQKILNFRPNEFKNDGTIYEKLITMQHYGLPTRLLDVTRNPLIALFFACNNLEKSDKDGIVFIFDKPQLLNPDDKKVNCLAKITQTDESAICPNCDDNCDNVESVLGDHFLRKNWFVRGVAKNQRISNQSGDFIFVGLGKKTRKNEELSKLPSRFLIIDYEVKEIILESLKVMNIHGGTVYPEISSMSNFLRNEITKK